jgi:TolA-binding protein
MSFNYIKQYPCWLTDPYIISNTSEIYDNNTVSPINVLLTKIKHLEEKINYLEEKIEKLSQKNEDKNEDNEDFEQIDF